MKIDVVLKIRTNRKPGNLARFATAVAELGGLIEDIETVHLGKDHTIREITVELQEEADHPRLIEALSGLSGIEVLGEVDQVFQLHEGGKIASRSTLAIERIKVLRMVYTPGVARVCQAIEREPALARRYTSIGNTVGIFTNGTRVLGLGDIGPQASMPVMEGKAALYSELIGLNAVPVLINTTDVQEFVDTVVRVAPTFGGVHLEDISSPACFEIEQRIDDALDIPVMHDDRHGTAVAVLAGLLTAARTLGIRLQDQVIAQIGLGAAGVGIADLLLAYGVKTVLAVDRQPENVARVPGATGAGLTEALASADIVVATTGAKGLIKPAQVRKGQIIFALSNPYPEINPADALAAGARFATDGSHVNNLLGFPGLFKGAMDTGSERIDHAMKIAAAEVIAARAPADELLPNALDRELHRAVAEVVARAARGGAAT
ncbi:MAG: malic enzyme-like NAD(P)-binding protein [Nannocystaceae bacterium]